jgi:hypothetical protein
VITDELFVGNRGNTQPIPAKPPPGCSASRPSFGSLEPQLNLHAFERNPNAVTTMDALGYTVQSTARWRMLPMLALLTAETSVWKAAKQQQSQTSFLQ